MSSPHRLNAVRIGPSMKFSQANIFSLMQHPNMKFAVSDMSNNIESDTIDIHKS